MKFCQKSTFECLEVMKVGDKQYHYYDMPAAAKALNLDLERLPYTLRVMLENLLRFEGQGFTSAQNIEEMIVWLKSEGHNPANISYLPSRVLMQDFTGVPAIVDLAAMRDACAASGADPQKVNPQIPVDLVIDHSVQVDVFATQNAAQRNEEIESQRNFERYKFLKWGQGAFKNFRVVPPGTGICHQVNIEYLASVVAIATDSSDKEFLIPDTVIGTDSHTTMVNGLGVLGWGVGGIEAEAAMLGQPISMLIPDVIGIELTGELGEGVTATDMVLSLTEFLRAKQVVGKFVEFIGSGAGKLSVADRATIGNMAPEYGATCGYFAIDQRTLEYLRLTGRSESHLRVVEQYSKHQGLWFDEKASAKIQYTQKYKFDLASIKPSLAGPTRPQDKVLMEGLVQNFRENFPKLNKGPNEIDFSVALKNFNANPARGFHNEKRDVKLTQGDIVISAITSCTNTSNPDVMIAAGLVAKKAVEMGLQVQPWVKTSLAPGSRAVEEYLRASGLQEYLDRLGFNIVGFGCTTCIGNSGPLPEAIEKAIEENKMVVASVLSGNRNFEGRIHPFVRANYLASPPLCVAYALLGNVQKDLASEPLGVDAAGRKIYLKDIWPTSDEIAEYVAKYVHSDLFISKYSDVFRGTDVWQDIPKVEGAKYDWDSESTYIKNPPFLAADNKNGFGDIKGARILMLLGDSITTDHISPAGRIQPQQSAGLYLQSKGVTPVDFNSFGARRGNHEVMMRGTFANVRIKNLMLENSQEGGFSYMPANSNTEGKEIGSVYDVAMAYQQHGVPLVIFAGKEYGTGSSRDWAAKGTKLLGIKAIIAESFERIHRSNLIGMGVLPLKLQEDSIASLNLKGDEVIEISGLKDLKPQQIVEVNITYADGRKTKCRCLARVDTEFELEYLHKGGILNYVLHNMIS